MKDLHCYIEGYPLEEHYSSCNNFLHNTLNWDLISAKISSEGVVCFEISEVLKLFPHLKLDENYRLFCYLTSGYHGVWGEIAAIKDGEPYEPITHPEKDQRAKQLFVGKIFELPEGSVPPLEAIYNDGSPYGFFEALLAEKFLRAIPYHQFDWERCILKYPEHFCSEWNIYERIPEVCPHIHTTKDGTVMLSVVWRHFEDGLDASDGRDTIQLSQHAFIKRLKGYHSMLRMKKSFSWYKAQIDDDSRYSESRYCCVSTVSSVTIAEQKDWRTLSEKEKAGAI